MKTITANRIIRAMNLFGMLICTSCTSMIMQEGERPWELRGAVKNQVDSTYGFPRFYGKRFTQLDKEIKRHARACSSCMSYSSYGIYDIKGPFPENDVTVSLEALYFSAFTLGAAEIFMLPSTLVERSYQRTQTKPFLFLFNSNEQTLCVEYASESTINLIEKSN